jgi:hypothetical protein
MVATMRDTLFRVTTRIFLPGLADKMEQEGTFNMFEGARETCDLDDYFIVDDRGADITVFAFAGMDVLFAGEPRFEFRRQLSSLDQPFNMVYIREMRRMLYHVCPYGTPDGLEFYTNHVRKIMEDLGSTYNVAMGSSGGGSAAFYFGTRCKMDQIIAFSPAFPATVWTDWRNQFRCYFNFKELFRSPAGYIEAAMVALSGNAVDRGMKKAIGGVQWDVMNTYLDAGENRPRASIFFGERCYPDWLQAQHMKDIPQVRLMPVDTGRHNAPAVLKEQGRLGDVLLQEFEQGLASRA